MVELCDASFRIRNRAGVFRTWHDNDEKPTSRDSELRTVRREELEAACADPSVTGFADFVQDLWRLRPGGVELDVAQVVSNWRWRYLQARGRRGARKAKESKRGLFAFLPLLLVVATRVDTAARPTRRWSLRGASTC